MRVSPIDRIAGLLLCLSSFQVDAQAVPAPGGGIVGACKSTGCSDCPTSADANGAFPNCIIYPSVGNLDGFEDPSSLNAYNVWWNSGPPNDGCRIIVRTPASTDLPECGLVLTSWEDAGCYFTKIQESFMLQFCCAGDCATATPASSAAEVRAMHLQGIGAITSLQFGNMSSMEDSGKRSVAEGVDMHWTRDHTASSMTQLAKKHPLGKRACSYTENQRFTKAGPQIRVSQTQNCNSMECAITIEQSISTSRTISASISAGFYGVVEASIGVEFTEEKSRTLSQTFTQEAGTRGYVSFAPTYDCTAGVASGCGDDPPDGPVDEVCTPRLIGAGTDEESNDGTLSFVFVAPGQD